MVKLHRGERDYAESQTATSSPQGGQDSANLMSVAYEPGRKKLRSCTIEDLPGTCHAISFRDSLVASDVRKSQETVITTIELPCS